MNNSQNFIGKKIEIEKEGKACKGVVTNFYKNPHTGIPILKVKMDNLIDASGRRKEFIFLSANAL